MFLLNVLITAFARRTSREVYVSTASLTLAEQSCPTHTAVLLTVLNQLSSEQTNSVQSLSETLRPLNFLYAGF